jgi:beta-lactam-binding protein with PASTA domain
MLVVPRALHGTVPNVVGLKLERAQNVLRSAKLDGVVSRFANGKLGRVLAQSPSAGTAAGHGLKIELVVGRPS